jgi:hypothetical protein
MTIKVRDPPPNLRWKQYVPFIHIEHIRIPLQLHPKKYCTPLNHGLTIDVQLKS